MELEQLIQKFKDQESENVTSYEEPGVNRFDAPIPGQSLTDTPGNYPWEHAPQFTDVQEVMDNLYDSLTTPKNAQQLIAMLDAGVPVEAVVRVITFAGFMEGKFNPDVGFTIIEPLMNLVSAIGIRAGVDKLKLSLEDLSNQEFISDMADLKDANEEIAKISKNIATDAPKEKKPQGLLAKPQTQEEKINGN